VTRYDPKLPSDTLAVAQVLAWRLPMLGLAVVAPNARRTAEAQRMIAEKQLALWQGLLAGQTASMQGWMRVWAAGMTPAATEALVHATRTAMTAPARTALRRNARRLSARKRM
jgi:hypothetical protein